MYIVKEDYKMKTYIAITIKTEGKYISSVICAGESDNLLSILKIENIHNATICSSKKKAYELSNYWNECYKKNGTHLYYD